MDLRTRHERGGESKREKGGGGSGEVSKVNSRSKELELLDVDSRVSLRFLPSHAQ